MKILEIAKKYNLEEEKALIITKQFEEFASIAQEWDSKAKQIVVTSIDQKEEMKLAREGRLILKNKRVEIEKRRKSLKESALREGQTIDAVAKALKELIEPIENYLDDQEKFAERMEAERIAKLTELRLEEVQPLSEFFPMVNNLGSLSDEDYQKLLNGAKLQLQAKIEAEQKAEQERIAKEKAEAEERERIRLENLKLKAEAEAREKELAIERAKVEAERKEAEAKARKEREEIEAKLRAEAEAKAKLEAEIRAKEEAEKRAIAKAEAERKANEEKLAFASDSEKLLTLSKQLEAISYPEVKSDLAVATIKIVKEQIEEIINSLKSLSEEC